MAWRRARFEPVLALTYLGWSASFVGMGAAVGCRVGSREGDGDAGPGLPRSRRRRRSSTAPEGRCSPYFPMLGSLPLAMAMFTPDTRVPTVAGQRGGAGRAVVLLDVMAGLPPRELLLQVSSFGLLGAVAIVGASRRTGA